MAAQRDDDLGQQPAISGGVTPASSAEARDHAGYAAWPTASHNGPITPSRWETRNSDDGSHILCGGPLDGQRIRFCRKGKDEAIEALVAIHWHYDGCVLDVDVTDECGTTVRLGLHPQFGDEVEVLG